MSALAVLHVLSASFIGPSAIPGWTATKSPAPVAAAPKMSLSAPFSFDSTSQTAYDYHDGMGMVGRGMGMRGGYGGMGTGGYGGYGGGMGMRGGYGGYGGGMGMGGYGMNRMGMGGGYGGYGMGGGYGGGYGMGGGMSGGYGGGYGMRGGYGMSGSGYGSMGMMNQYNTGYNGGMHNMGRSAQDRRMMRGY